MTNSTEIISGLVSDSNITVTLIIAGGSLLGLITFIIKIHSNIDKNRKNRKNLLRNIKDDDLLSYLKKELIQIKSKNLNISIVFIIISILIIILIFIQLILNLDEFTGEGYLQLFFAALGTAFVAYIVEKFFFDMDEINEFSNIEKFKDIFINVKDEAYIKGLEALNNSWSNLSSSQKENISESLASQIIQKEKEKETDSPAT